MHTPAKTDFLRPLLKKRLQTDFPAGFDAVADLGPEAFARLAQAGIALPVPIAVTARFDGKDRLVITLAGQVEGGCARCLSPVGVTIDVTCRFRLFETEAQADQALSALDPEEPVCDADGQSLRDLIEDEVLMQMAEPVLHGDCAMPEIPDERAGGDTSTRQTPASHTDAVLADDRQRPFAGLQQLLGQNPPSKKS